VKFWSGVVRESRQRISAESANVVPTSLARSAEFNADWDNLALTNGQLLRESSVCVNSANKRGRHFYSLRLEKTNHAGEIDGVL
jgi:hypothetical protein